MKWFVLRSKPDDENLLRGQLFSHQIEFYFPTMRVKTVNPRSQKIKLYFQCYLLFANGNQTAN